MHPISNDGKVTVVARSPGPGFDRVEVVVTLPTYKRPEPGPGDPAVGHRPADDPPLRRDRHGE